MKMKNARGEWFDINYKTSSNHPIITKPFTIFIKTTSSDKGIEALELKCNRSEQEIENPERNCKGMVVPWCHDRHHQWQETPCESGNLGLGLGWRRANWSEPYLLSFSGALGDEKSFLGFCEEGKRKWWVLALCWWRREIWEMVVIYGVGGTVASERDWLGG